MRLPLAVRTAVLSLACLGLVLPPSVFGASPAASRPAQAQPTLQVADAALGPQGVLRGKVVDAQGQPVADARVVLAQRSGPVAEAQTDAEGRFAVANLRHGVYAVGAAEGVGIYRLWPSSVAPPSATSDVLIVSDGTLVRGQGGMYQWMSEHFWLSSALIVTAIALPVALINDKDPSTGN